jgi:hypothetical protein
MNDTYPIRLTISRCLIAAVVLVNLQCAILFLIKPEIFLSAFELSGIPGAAAIRGIGLLFLMWNVPYLVAFYNPIRNKAALYEAIVMQTIGLLGESTIYASLPLVHAQLRDSITRFILFDASGWVALIAALYLIRSPQQ